MHERETMTSKERVMKAFNHVKADRVPINYMSNPGIHKRLLAHYNLKSDDYEGLLKQLWVDFRSVGAAYTGPRLHAEIKDRQVDPLFGIHRRYIEHPSGGYWDYCDFPLKDADEEMVANWPMPNPDDFDYSSVAEQCKNNEEYAIALHCFGDLINGNTMLRSMEQTLVDLILDEPAGILLGDRRFDFQMARAERILEAANGSIDFVWLGEDLGTQKRPMISMEIFRKHIKPRYKKLIDMANNYGAKTMIHTCGSSSWAYEDFLEIGIDAVDTLQPECVDMSPQYLVDTFGGRLSFHGCISTAGPLTYETPVEVRQNVQETLDIMMPTASYMLSPTHSIQDNTPTENVVEMYDAAKELGWY